MIYQGRTYKKVARGYATPAQKKKKINVSKIIIFKKEKALEQEITGVFSRLGVNPRTVEEVLEMQQPTLNVVAEKPKFKKSNITRKFIKKNEIN
jgi:hypothetical protein